MSLTMKVGSAKPVRCAIYTRVSTDQGLEQDFNSLDAQYDASQAYIRSQAHAGWALLRGKYDDGGGEHVEDDIFRVVDISVQHSGGSHVCFVRQPHEHQAQLDEFFRRTGADYTRFNYLGEWHSHPSFQPLPSVTDMQTMQSIVDDPDVGMNFLVLLVPRLVRWRKIDLTAMAFRRGGDPFPVLVRAEQAEAERPGILARYMRCIFRL